MAKFGMRSTREVGTCNPDIQAVLNEAIKYMDFSVLKGHRGKEEQNEAHARGASQLKYPDSLHNPMPSDAVDIVPFPVDWDDLPRFHELAGVIRTVCQQKNIKLEWGGDWKSFKDYPHWQLKKEARNGSTSSHA